MKYLYLAVAVAAGWMAWRHLPQLRQSDGEGAEEMCSQVNLLAEVQPLKSSGRPWDLDSPPDVAFQVGSRWSGVCQNSFTCELPLVLPVPAHRFELNVWDRDSDDKIAGEGAKNELIVNGRVPVNGVPAVIGLATITVSCLD